MKTKLFYLIIVLLSNAAVCLAEGGNVLSINKVPNSNNHLPHRSSLYGEFNTITQTLTLTANTDDTVEEVNIYKDGVLIVSDQEPLVTVYNLSSYGNGTYSVEVVLESGNTYTGSFSY